ncbi:7-deoxyloganetic acid glucosyl transferase-like isoform X2 [Rutidosis leptorrhynchoides]|uniref:7-deoxyloganetic acid glucosyl transferase-like isoform X2 n=1 Tax=Rutidosis leptorrhynchoides TaxID=125765 RepID=UPI003A990128
MDQSTLPPHVLIFPLPLQGPVNSMFKLAELLCLSGFHITFLVTDHIHTRLLKYSNIQSRFERYPGFQLETISDGLPEDHPRSGNGLMEMFDSLKTKNKILFKDLLTSGKLNLDSRRPVTCIIADGIMGYTCDVANDVGIPIIFVRTISACCLWVFFCLPKLIESGELPFSDNDLDTPIKSIPGMESFFRRRDLPSFCRSGNLWDPSLQLYLPESTENPRAYGLIINTFDDLEGPILAQIRTLCPNLYTIGPLHSHLKYKLSVDSSSPLTSSNSLWKEDTSCITWLDSQPSKSVIYVSFGSLAVMTKEQYMEFWYGLVNSGSRFLWVIRPDSVTNNSSEIPLELSEGTKERGYIVEWAPQEEVLAHNAVGGFLTHSGWNSTLESVIEGVPMICWPYFLDQQVNSRFVGEVWKLGLDMKDTCDRLIIEKTVRELMDGRKDEFMNRADQMKKLAKQCLSEGGSSYCNLERLIKDIKDM